MLSGFCLLSSGDTCHDVNSAIIVMFHRLWGLAVIDMLPFVSYELVSYHNDMIHHC